MNHHYPWSPGRRALSCAIAAIFPAIGISAFSLPAHAACDTAGSIVTCSGTVPGGFSAGAATGLTVDILNGATIQANVSANPTLSVLVNGDSTITNSGTIQNAGGKQTNNFAVSLNGSNTLFTNNGTLAISISAGDITAGRAASPVVVFGTRTLRGIIASSGGDEFSNVQVVNTGSITLEHAGVGNGQLIYGGEALDDITVDNRGTISVNRSSALTVVVVGGALQARTAIDPTNRALGIVAGIDSDDDTGEYNIVNRSRSVIEASGDYTAAISGRAGEISIDNSGIIRNNSGGIAIGTQSAADDGPGETELVNRKSGVIVGDIYMVDGNLLRLQAINKGLTGVTVNQVGVRDSEITNQGTITGNLYFGSGNHEVTNSGTITGNIAVNQNTLAGITEPGSRTFTLSNSGRLNGNVTLTDVAASHNTITLSGDGFSGHLTATGAGTNNLFLQGSGTLHGNVNHFTALHVGGPVASAGGEEEEEEEEEDDDDDDAPSAGGVWKLASGTTQQFSAGTEIFGGSTLLVNSTLASDVTVDPMGTLGGSGIIQGVVMNNGTVDVGASMLTVTGGVNMGSGSRLKTTIFGPGGASAAAPSDNAGQLVVGATGTASADAKIVPVVVGAIVHNGDWYRVGRNSAGGSVFSTVPGVQNSGLISWQVQENADDDLVIGATVMSPSSIPGLSSGGLGALNSLFNYTGSNPQLIAIGSALQSASTADLKRAAEQLRPENSNGQSQASLRVSNQVQSVVGGHLEQLRLADRGQTGVSTGDAVMSHGVWAQGFGFFGNQNAQDGIDGYTAGSAGAAIGADTLVGADGALRLGGAFSYARTTVKGEGASSTNTTDISSYVLTGYGSYDLRRWYLDGALSLGQHQYDSRRVIDSAGISDVATSSHDGKQYAAKVEAGYPLSFGTTTLIPVASLSYVRLDQDAYTESSANGTALAVDSSDTNSFRTGLGAKARLPVSDGDVNTIVELRAIWLHELGDTSQATTAQFVAGGSAFTTNGMNLSRDSLNLGAGMVIAGDGDHQRLTVNYDAEIRSGYIGQSLSLQFRYQF